MQPTRGAPALKPIVALALLLIGVAGFGLWRVIGGNEDLPYRSDATPPAAAHVTRDDSYTLAVPGGVPAMLARGVPQAGTSDNPTISLQCAYTSGGLANQTLETSAESIGTKAVNVVGTFVSPTTGNIAVTCQGWGAMFVTDADNRDFDTAGAALLIGSIAFAIGACLMLGVAYASWSERRERRGRSGGEGRDLDLGDDVALWREQQ